MISIVPIAKTVCDWETFLKITQSTLHRNVADNLDSRNIQTRGLLEYVSSLGEFHSQGTDALKIQRDAGFLLKHLSISFLVCLVTDKNWLYQATELKIIDCESSNIFVITGTLEQWREAIINLCSPNVIYQYRYIGTAFLTAFDKLGCSRLFENYSRQINKDSILLIEKK